MSAVGFNPLAYEGVKAPNPPNMIRARRAPNAQDINHDLGTFWLDELTQTMYVLVSLLGGVATWDAFNGSLSLPQPGTTLEIEGGAVTDFIGTATLVAGTVTIAHTGITAADRIMVTRSDINGSTALGVFEVVKTPSTNFVINARNPADATIQTNDVSIVEYVITRQL